MAAPLLQGYQGLMLIQLTLQQQGEMGVGAAVPVVLLLKEQARKTVSRTCRLRLLCMSWTAAC